MTTLSDDGKTLTMTWTLHLTEPLTEKERDIIIGNIYEHIFSEQHADIPGFVKVADVVAPDGKYHTSVRDMMDSIEGAFLSEGVRAIDPKKHRASG